jgi:predicted ATP-dependent endonuclease of OLD family
MYIKKIRIANFRSIHDQTIDLSSSFTAVVGTNDVGKSNLLRGLNLFFNNQTDLGTNFNFQIDYSHQASESRSAQIQKKAPEIVIEVWLKPPESYSDQREIRWRKVWRREGLHLDQLQPVDGEPFVQRSRNQSWAQTLRFEYIPAMRDDDYSRELRRRLYSVLAETIGEKINGAPVTFCVAFRVKFSR